MGRYGFVFWEQYNLSTINNYGGIYNAKRSNKGFFNNDLLTDYSIFTIIAIAEDEIRVIIDIMKQYSLMRALINEDGRTMVPIRFISEQLGALVSRRRKENVVTIEKDKR